MCWKANGIDAPIYLMKKVIAFAFLKLLFISVFEHSFHTLVYLLELFFMVLLDTLPVSIFAKHGVQKPPESEARGTYLGPFRR